MDAACLPPPPAAPPPPPPTPPPLAALAPSFPAVTAILSLRLLSRSWKGTVSLRTSCSNRERRDLRAGLSWRRGEVLRSKAEGRT